MLTYFDLILIDLVFLVCLLFPFVWKNEHSNLFIVPIVMITSVFLLLASLRDTSFTFDTLNYISWFERVAVESDLMSIFTVNVDRNGLARDPGFSFFLWCLSKISNDPIFLLVVFSASILFFVIKIAKLLGLSNKDLLVFLILILSSRMFFEFTTNQYRSTIVFLVCIYAFLRYQRKGGLISLLLIPLMLLFHKKVVVMFLMVLLIARICKLQWLRWMIPVSILVFIFPFIILWPMEQFIYFFSKFGSFLYTPSFINESAGTTSYITVGFVVLYTLPFIFLLFMKLRLISESDIFLLKVSLVCFILFFSTYQHFAESFRLMQVSIPVLTLLAVKYVRTKYYAVFFLLVCFNILVINKNVLEMQIGVFSRF